MKSEKHGFIIRPRRVSKNISEPAGAQTPPINPTPTKQPLPIIRYLIYLIILTTTVTGISMSRYGTVFTVDSPARVADFNVSVTPYGWYDDNKSGHVTGGSVKYTFLIKNNSEVAIKARLVNADTGNPILPVTVENASWQAVTYDTNGWFMLSPIGTSDDTRYVSASFSDTVGNGNGVQYKMRIEYEQID